MEFTIGYQPVAFHCCRLSGSSFTEGLQKHNDDVILYFRDSKFPYFVKLVISYQPAKFQILLLSQSKFTEVFIGHSKVPLWRHYDVTSQYLHFKISHFVKRNQRYQLAKFIGLSWLDQVLRGLVENTPHPLPHPDLQALKKPSSERVKAEWFMSLRRQNCLIPWNQRIWLLPSALSYPLLNRINPGSIIAPCYCFLNSVRGDVALRVNRLKEWIKIDWFVKTKYFVDSNLGIFSMMAI